MSIYDLSFTDNSGNEVKLDTFKGKNILIVNTASHCGYTTQYSDLQKAYGDDLIVIAFPCNQFGNQDPGSNQAIAQYCQVNYGVSFTMLEKINVNGPDAHPLYQWLCAEAPGLLGSKAIKWNFTKFLIGRDGRVIKRYASLDKPEKMAQDIEAALTSTH